MRVGVIGAGGRLGAVACRAIDDADGLELAAAVQPSAAGSDLGDLVGVGEGVEVLGRLDALEGAVDVAVEVTRPPNGARHAAQLLDLGIHAVVGTSGVTDEDLARLRDRAEVARANVLVVPNFALGAVLLQQFAEAAARHLPHAEVVELHHDAKADAPSGTALTTAGRIAAARSVDPTPVGGDDDHPGARGHTHRGVPIHSVRLPGLVAHQEVLFGGIGEVLTLRHDSLSRDSFAAGIVLAVRGVGNLDGVTVGLDPLLA